MTSGSWTTTSGSWSTSANWGLGSGFPDTAGDTATLGATLNTTAGTRTITLGDGATRTIGRLDITATNAINYELAAGGTSSMLNFDVASGRAAINVSAPGGGSLTSRFLSSVNVLLSDTTNVTLTRFDSKLQIDGVISGGGGLEKFGAGVLTLMGANTFSGGLLAGATGVLTNRGRVELGTGTSLGSGAVTVGSNNEIQFLALETMTVANTFNQSGLADVSLGAQTGKTLTYTGAYNVNGSAGLATLSINGNAASSQESGGTVIWQGSGGANTAGFNLRVVINNGTLQVGNANLSAYTGDGGATTIGSDAALDLHGLNLTVSRLFGSGTVKSDTGAATLTLASSDTATFAGVIADGTGQINLVKDLASTQTLSGVNTYTGTTTIKEGILSLGQTGSIAASSLVDVESGGTFLIQNPTGPTSVRNLNLQAGGVLEMLNATLTITQAATGMGAGTLQGNGAGIETLIVQAATDSYSLAGVQFVNWLDGTDLIVINGGAVDNTLTGSSRADGINGGGGADTINGGNGADTLNGDAGADGINGGGGNDLIAAASAGTQTGDAAGNTLNGDDGNDTLIGSDGADTLSGGADNDSLIGGGGIDSLVGDAGNDTLIGGAGTDTLRGGNNDDRFVYASSLEIQQDSIDGGTGVDRIEIAFAGLADFSNATFGSTGTSSIEELVLLGAGGHDVTFLGSAVSATGLSSALSVVGVVGSTDRIIFNNITGSFNISAFSFGDWTDGVDQVVLSGGNGAETIIGSGGDDLFHGSDGADSLVGNFGADRFIYQTTAQAAGDTIRGSGAGDAIEVTTNNTIDFSSTSIVAIERLLLSGASGNNVTFSGAQTVNGAQLSLSLQVRGNNGGADIITFNNVGATASVFNLSSYTFADWEARDGVVINIAFSNINVIGSVVNDTINGNGGDGVMSGRLGDDRLNGNGGKDSLFGNEGNDTLDGGTGNDSLDGGDGADTILFTGARANYTIAAIANGFTVTDNRGAGFDGVDTVLNAESFVFADQTRTAANLLNLPPAAPSLAGNTVAENAGAGTFVGTLSATDPDGNPLTFTLDAAGAALFNVTGNQLSLKAGANIDFEAGATRAFLATAVDSTGAPGPQASLTLNITNVNEAPGTPSLVGNTVAENAGSGTVIGTLSATDPDGTTPAFQITGGSGASLFAISGNSLVVAPGAVLDFEAGATREVQIISTDGALNSAAQSFTINLSNVNEAPGTPSLAGNTVAENAAAGTVVGTLSATDPDGTTPSFQIVGGGGASLFAISGNALVVAPGAVLDFEAGATREVQIISTDGALNSAAQSFTITLTDVLEGIDGGPGPDTMTGTPDRDAFNGLGGNDTLLGLGNADSLFGNADNDVLIGDGPLSLTSAAAAIRRLYIATLDRAPDDGGWQGWVTARESGQTLDTIAAGFVNSTEFQTKYGALDNTDFVKTLYRNVLDREADQGGLDANVAALNSGALTRTQIVVNFSESGEFINGTMPSTHAGQIFRLYGAALARQPDAGGFEGWTDIMGGGRGLVDIAAGFVGSLEFQTTYGSLDNTAFVTLLYQNVLGRAPDAGGLAGWKDLLDTGALTRTQVVTGFSESGEYINGTRAATDAFMRNVMVTWSDTLVGGAGHDKLTGGRGSDRYVFTASEASNDTIYGFESFDTLQLTGFGFADPAAALSAASQQGADVVLGYSGGSITFADTQLATLQNLTAQGWVFG